MGEADMGEAKDCGDSDRQTGGGWHDGVRPVIDRHSSIGSDNHSDVNCEMKTNCLQSRCMMQPRFSTRSFKAAMIHYFRHVVRSWGYLFDALKL